MFYVIRFFQSATNFSCIFRISKIKHNFSFFFKFWTVPKIHVLHNNLRKKKYFFLDGLFWFFVLRFFFLVYFFLLLSVCKSRSLWSRDHIILVIPKILLLHEEKKTWNAFSWDWNFQRRFQRFKVSRWLEFFGN